jgi:hypothetical protein
MKKARMLGGLHKLTDFRARNRDEQKYSAPWRFQSSLLSVSVSKRPGAQARALGRSWLSDDLYYPTRSTIGDQDCFRCLPPIQTGKHFLKIFELRFTRSRQLSMKRQACGDGIHPQDTV